MFVLDADVEHAGDGLAAHRRAIFLTILSVGPGSHKPAPALSIRDHRWRELTNSFHVQFAERSSAGVSNVACAWIDRPDLLVPQAPEIEEPLLSPDDVLLS